MPRLFEGTPVTRSRVDSARHETVCHAERLMLSIIMIYVRRAMDRENKLTSACARATAATICEHVDRANS